MANIYLDKLKWDLLIFKHQNRLLSSSQKGRPVFKFSLCLFYHA